MKSIIQLATLSLLAIATLASCNKHDDKTIDSWNGEIRLTSGITAQTRAGNDVPDQQIAAGKIVSFFVDDAGTKAQLYEDYGMTANGSGGFTKNNPNEKDMFYPATGNNVDIYAFLTDGFVDTPTFPASAITHTVSSDQSIQYGDNYLASDLLYAASKGVVRSPKAVTMNFYHMLSKVEVALKAGAGAPDLTGAVVTIENTQLKADFLPLKNAAINGTTAEAQAARAGMVTLTTADNPATPIKIGTAVSNDFSAYASAVVVPQTVATGKRFIKVTLASGGELYYTIPDADGLKLESGNKYQLHITVSLTGLTVKSTIADWATNVPIGGTAEMPGPIGSKSAEQAAVGDFYFSDGTLEGKDATLTDEQKAACLGIVFWVGDPTNTTNGDPLLKTQHSGCTHGLVVALHEAKQPSASAAATMKWSVSYEQVNNWTNHSDRSENKVNITEQNRYQGYANTVALKAYNALHSNDNYKVLPIAAVEQYQTDYPAPTNSSGWYMPSIMELKYMCRGQVNGESTDGRDLLNGQFAKVGGTNFDGLWYYWSSSEDADSSDYARNVLFEDGYVGSIDKYNRELWVRALFAF